VGAAVRDVLGPHPLAAPITDFLTDLHNVGRSAQTLRAYRGDLIGLASHNDGGLAELGAPAIRAFLSERVALAPATRRRARASVASFCRWAVRHELLDSNPVDRI
jgi:integrase/recombinase XerC/integrase/recombinase XerD